VCARAGVTALLCELSLSSRRESYTKRPPLLPEGSGRAPRRGRAEPRLCVRWRGVPVAGNTQTARSCAVQSVGRAPHTHCARGEQYRAAVSPNPHPRVTVGARVEQQPRALCSTLRRAAPRSHSPR
jgi:hypothetical protein